MDSIEQYEALLKQWGYEDDKKAKAQRRQARIQMTKKAVEVAKVLATTLLKITHIKLSSHKLAA